MNITQKFFLEQLDILIKSNTNLEEQLKKFLFSAMQNIHPEICPCYQGKKCHSMKPDHLSCLFCYCPFYDTSQTIGGCKINSKKGKWYYHKNFLEGQVWDCSNCTIPHTPEFVLLYIEKLRKK